MLTVIVPTYDRVSYLRDALLSILKQDLPYGQYEIIVVDNKPGSEVSRVIQKLKQEWHQSIHYIAESHIGLHNARHAGAKAAQGEILVYADDDIIATPHWLKAIKNAFDNPDVALVGGKILPKWEGNIPDWLNAFREPVAGYGWIMGYLSLLDFGDETKEIPAYYVFGCNFSIRKSALFECGGFHPDGVPQELIRYRGDGETALSLAIMEKGYKSVYEPHASVYHRVPPGRLTVDYFCRRAFNQGVSDSYTEIRQEHELAQPALQSSKKFLSLWENYKKLLMLLWKGQRKLLQTLTFHENKTIEMACRRHPVIEQVTKAYEEGKSYHKSQVAEDPELLGYILREIYY